MVIKEMSREEIDQFLTCARVGRLGIALEDGAYVVPVGFAYHDGKVFFHTCCKGLKVEALRKNPSVCFEVDEALSDLTMSRSVVLFGTAEIIKDENRMIPYLQMLIDKYRIPQTFDEYMQRPGRKREVELKAVRICLITPTKVTGRELRPREGLYRASN